jgi:carboxylate-amine ligase
MPIPFEASPRPTLGIEEEYQLCDPNTGELLPRVESIMEQAGPDLRARLSYDLILPLIEANTEISATVEEGIEHLLDKRRRVQALAEAAGCTLGLTGTHPFADPKAVEFVDTPDYQWVHDQLGYVAQRNITFGLHVHVGVDDADRAVYIANRMRQWIGPLIALAANSPFLDGVDTGWNAARVYAFGAFPRAGIPPRLESYASFAAEIDSLIAAGAITKPRQIWWNLRVHPQYGTVEFRACDVQISLARTAALVGVIQALIVAYGDAHRSGEPEPYLPGSYLEDLRWKGMRFGLDADVIDAETAEVMSMHDYVRRMISVAAPAADKLGTTAYLDAVADILDTGNEATAQRALAQELGGDLTQLQLKLLEKARDIGIYNPETVAV